MVWVGGAWHPSTWEAGAGVLKITDQLGFHRKTEGWNCSSVVSVLISVQEPMGNLKQTERGQWGNTGEVLQDSSRESRV